MRRVEEEGLGGGREWNGIGPPPFFFLFFMNDTGTLPPSL